MKQRIIGSKLYQLGTYQTGVATLHKSTSQGIYDQLSAANDEHFRDMPVLGIDLPGSEYLDGITHPHLYDSWGWQLLWGDRRETTKH